MTPTTDKGGAARVEAGGAGHTPGPWKFGHLGTEALWVGPDHDQSPVAIVPWDCNGARDNARVNASAIAALPDLLALAEALKRWLMTDVEPSHVGREDMRVYHLDGGALSNLLNDARAAIAKAQGR